MRKNCESVMSYFGGKNSKLNYILPLLPPHKTYVEPFAGSLAVFFAKDPTPIEVVNDIDGDLVNFYRVLRDPFKAKELEKSLKLTLYSRQEFEENRDIWKSDRETWNTLTDVERAARWYIVHEMSFGAYHKAFRYSVSHAKRGIAGAVSSWILHTSKFMNFHYRIRNAIIENRDFRTVIETYDTEETFHFIDPPYVHETRGTHRYDNEISMQDQKELVILLLKIKGKALLTCYDHAVYYPLLDNGWSRYNYKAKATAIVPNRKIGQLGEGMLDNEDRTETMYYNYTI